jgi:hypothetical protein
MNASLQQYLQQSNENALVGKLVTNSSYSTQFSFREKRMMLNQDLKKVGV